MPTATAPAAPSNLQTPGDEEEEDEEEMIRRLAWIRYYVKNNDTEKALELGGAMLHSGTRPIDGGFDVVPRITWAPMGLV